MQAPLAQLPWYHHIALMERLKSRGDRILYAALAVENGWSRNVMIHQIDQRVADQHGKAVTNFRRLMPPLDSDMAEQTLKGEYDLGFLPATLRTTENRLRTMLVDRVARFLIELGAGFSYVGKVATSPSSSQANGVLPYSVRRRGRRRHSALRGNHKSKIKLSVPSVYSVVESQPPTLNSASLRLCGKHYPLPSTHYQLQPQIKSALQA